MKCSCLSKRLLLVIIFYGFNWTIWLHNNMSSWLINNAAREFSSVSYQVWWPKKINELFSLKLIGKMQQIHLSSAWETWKVRKFNCCWKVIENLSYCMFGRLSLQMSKQGQCRMEMSNKLNSANGTYFGGQLSMCRLLNCLLNFMEKFKR